jgi:hypothetical protein
MSPITQTLVSTDKAEAKSEPTRLQLEAWMNFRNLVATQPEINYMYNLYSVGKIEIDDLDEWFYAIDHDSSDLYLIKHKWNIRYISRLRSDAAEMYKFLTKSH